MDADLDLLLVDSTRVECARSRETVKRGGASSLNDALANAADYVYPSLLEKAAILPERLARNQPLP